MADNSVLLSSSTSPNERLSNGNNQPVAANTNGRKGMKRDIFLAAERGSENKLRWLNNWKHEKTPIGNNVLHVHVGKPQRTTKDVVNLGFIRYVLNETADNSALSQTNDKGDTPLHLAARFGQMEAVQEFLQQAEVGQLVLNKVNNNMDTALHDAARSCHDPIVKLLVEHDFGNAFDHMPNQFGETPLFLAAERGLTESFGTIVGRTGLTSLDHRGPCGQTPLHAAVLCGNKDIVDKILEIDTSGSLIRIKNDEGQTPLHCCAARNLKTQQRILRALLDNDDEYNSAAYIQDNEGRTAIHIATLNFNFKGAKMLIRSYPDCTEVVDNKGQNVVHLAANSGRLRTFEWFIIKAPKCERLINEKDNDGNSPLHLLAASTPTIRIHDWRFELSSFINRHDKLHVRVFNNQNLTAGDIIASNDHFDHAKLIKKLRKALPRGKRINNCDERAKGGVQEGRLSNVKEKESKRVEERISKLRKEGETRLVVAALIVTVSFAAGFTVPGGFDQTPGQNIGLAVLANKYLFVLFVISDTIAFMMSCVAVMCYFAISGNKDLATINGLSRIAEFLISYSLGALMVAFQSGVSVVVSQTLGEVIHYGFLIFLSCYGIAFNKKCGVVRIFFG